MISDVFDRNFYYLDYGNHGKSSLHASSDKNICPCKLI
jgi:hypothetical protein